MSSKSFLPLLVLFLLLCMPSVRAATITWSSTVEFDSGTKSDAGNGNYAVETSTDNLGVAAGSIELSSAKGDSFTHSWSPDTFKWTPREKATTASYTSNTQPIVGGVLNIFVTTTSGGSVFGGVTSDKTVSGDFDVRVKFIGVSGTEVARLQVLNEPSKIDFAEGTTTEGVLYQISPILSGNIRAFTVNNGAATQCGTNTVVPSNPLWLRVVKATSLWTFYYSTDGSTWTTDESCTQAAVTDFTVGLMCVVSVASTCSIQFDDFYFFSGTLVAGSYQTSGSWTSSYQTVSYLTTEMRGVIANVTVTYSGASASNYITRIDLVNAAGSILSGNDDDRTSGASAFLTYDTTDVTLYHDWAIKITFAGSGSGTVNIQSVVAQTSVVPLAAPSSGGGTTTIAPEVFPVIIMVALLFVSSFLSFRFPILGMVSLLTGIVAAIFIYPLGGVLVSGSIFLFSAIMMAMAMANVTKHRKAG